MNLALPLLRSCLLIALVLSGSVPAGMMHASGADGVRLVLCTPEGTKEVWLAEDGTATPVEDEAPSDHGNRPHCVQVSLHAADWTLPRPVPATWQHRPASVAALTHQVSHHPAPSGPRLSRAPPLPS